MAVIIVDAEISILRLMHRPETRVPLCVHRGGGRERERLERVTTEG